MESPEFRSPALRSLCHDVVYWHPPIDDGHGEKKWSIPVQCWGRFIEVQQLAEWQEGIFVERNAGSVIIDFTDMNEMPYVQGYIWHGCIKDLDVIDKPPLSGYADNIAKRILRVRKAYPMNDRLMSLAILTVG